MVDFSNENILHVKTEEIEYIQFKKLLEYGIPNAYTLRGDNIDFSGDSENEESSYKKICDELKIGVDTLLKPCQSHTSVVKCINKVIKIEDLKNIDGLITNTKNISLTTKNADCILFLIYDPVKRVIANVHSGWKGTFKKIIEKAVVKMITHYNSDPKDIICCISPSIRKCHFEVDEDVKELYESIFEFTKQSKDFISVGEIKENKQKYLIDTVLINKILLLNLGLKEENIIDCNICSMCNSDKIYSARVEGEKYKRATAIISLI